jgi:hypothetical protein
VRYIAAIMTIGHPSASLARFVPFIRAHVGVPVLALSLGLAASTACVGCDSSRPAQSATQEQADYRARAASQLESSSWRLASWVPEQPLEPMFQALLAQQLASMTIRFAQGRVHADSPTVHIDRAYQVADASGPQFVVVTTDNSGGTLRTSAQLSDDGATLSFRGETEPWRGSGTLVRVAGGAAIPVR